MIPQISPWWTMLQLPFSISVCDAAPPLFNQKMKLLLSLLLCCVSTVLTASLANDADLRPLEEGDASTLTPSGHGQPVSAIPIAEPVEAEDILVQVALQAVDVDAVADQSTESTGAAGFLQDFRNYFQHLQWPSLTLGTATIRGGPQRGFPTQLQPSESVVQDQLTPRARTINPSSPTRWNNPISVDSVTVFSVCFCCFAVVFGPLIASICAMAVYGFSAYGDLFIGSFVMTVFWIVIFCIIGANRE